MALLASKSQYLPQSHAGSHFQSSNPTPVTAMFTSHSQPSPTNSEFSEGGQAQPDDVRSWDERKVVEWLRSIGCQKYDSVFERNNITGETLLECDHSALKELGITKVGDRVRIFVAVKALRTKAFGNSGKKRNRDTLAALDNVGPVPSYRTQISPPQNKRYSRQFADIGASALSSTVYTESPTENDYTSTRRSGAPRIISPPPDCPRSGNSYGSKTPRTPQAWKGSNPQSGSPNNTRRHDQGQGKSIMEFDSVRKNCIKVIGEGGATRVVDISGCNTPEAVMRRILKKYSIMDNFILWAIYTITKDHNGRENIRCLGDADLLRIAHDSDRPERSRLILKRRGSPPSPSSAEFMAALQMARDETPSDATSRALEGNASRAKLQSLTGEHISSSPPSRSRDSTLGRKAASKKMTAFFGQRPPSELISSNLAEYFPDHEHKALERTVRNSMRRSARMSRYTNRLSVATTRSYASSMSGDSVPPVPTVGGIWLNQSPQSTMLPSSLMQPRPPSVGRPVLMPTTFGSNEYLGAVPEDDVSPDRRSYMSFDSHDGRAVSVVVTDTDENTLDTAYSMDNQSMVSTPTIETSMGSSFLDQSLGVDDSEEEEGDDDDYMDDNMEGLRWMKGTLIGAGSFGSVFLALNSLTGELMAVKQVEMPTSTKEDARKQSMIDALAREIALLKDLQHPNIVQYLSSSKEDNCFNIFLEYVPGGSVAAMLNNYGPLKEPLVRNFVRQILQGLAYLHGKNIIHRDIKGANVLVDNKGGIKISDFGISKKVEAGLLNSSAAHHRPSLQGSVFWMAPEVVKQTSYTLKADIWSLGCLVVEMLTGSHPYPDCSQLQAIFKIGTGGSAPAIPQKCTAEAKTFLAQTFELDHNKRPTAEALLTSPFMLPLVGNGQNND